MCHNINYSLRKLVKSCDLCLWKHYKEAPCSHHWLAYRAVSCFVVVGKYWEGKGKSKPSLYMGGKLLSGINAFVSKIYLIIIALSYYGFIFHSGNRIQLEESHTYQEIMWTNHSCQYAVFHYCFYNYIILDYDFDIFLLFWLIVAKMESPVYFYITSKSSNPNSYIGRLVCILCLGNFSV